MANTITNYDWSDAVALIDRVWLPPGAARIGAVSYERPDGTFGLLVGSTAAVLAVTSAVAPQSSARTVGYDDRISFGIPSPRQIERSVIHKRPLVFGTDCVWRLRGTCGPVPVIEQDVSSACPECDGTGEVTCYACDHEHECRDCSGTGRITSKKIAEPPARFLVVGGAAFDARLLAPLLAHVPDGSVTVGLFGSTMLELDGAGWSVRAMATERGRGLNDEEVRWTPQQAEVKG